MSVFHNADVSNVVKFAIHGADGRLVEHVVLPGDECSVPDVYDAAVPCLAPQMKKGPAPEPPPAVAPPPKDPKKQAAAAQK